MPVASAVTAIVGAPTTDGNGRAHATSWACTRGTGPARRTAKVTSVRRVVHRRVRIVLPHFLPYDASAMVKSRAVVPSRAMSVGPPGSADRAALVVTAVVLPGLGRAWVSGGSQPGMSGRGSTPG